MATNSVYSVFTLLIAAIFFSGSVLAVPIGHPGLPQKPVADQSPAEKQVTRGFEALAIGDLKSAEAAFTAAFTLEPKQIGAMLGSAELHLRRKQPREAEARLKEALAAEPDNAEVHAAYGRYHFGQGRYTQAESAYQKAISLDKGNFLAHMDLADLYLSIKRTPKAAAEIYRKAVTLKPAYSPARFGLGMALLAAGDKPGAMAELQQATRLGPQDPTPLHVIGRIHASDKQFEQAVQSLTAALRAKSDFMPALIDRADVYAEMEKNREAAADYERVLTANPKDSISRVKLGMIYQRLHRLDDAETAYHAALKVNPGLAPAYNNLAMIALEKEGNLPNALSWAKKAVELAPNTPQFHDTLGWVHRALGDKAAAVAALERASRLPPPQAEIWYRLGLVYQETGNRGKAAAAYKKALVIQADFPQAAEAKARIAALGK